MSYYNETYAAKPPENYERFFVPVIGEPLAKDLIRLADLKQGERVLDVACGTGIIARMALMEVGNEGTVDGIDINPGMLAVARSISNNSHIQWHEASAEKMPFTDESFDVAICQLGLQFMEDKTAALQEMHRVLKSGGRLFLNVPGPAGPVFAFLADAMERNISHKAGMFVRHVFSLNDTDIIRQLINNAGFRETDIQARNKMISLPAPIDFLWQYIYSTPLAGELSEADSEQQTSLENEVTAHWQNFVDGNGTFQYEQRVITASAMK
ncbi:MAG: methyltransferase domain-containing protein [Balneolales bacterium]